MEAQENRSERLTIAATERETRAVKAVALVRGTDVSNLLRDYRLVDIMAEYARMAEALTPQETVAA